MEIEDHVDRRIQLFFMQLICCYNTPYTFSWGKAEDQYGTGGIYKVKNEAGRTTTVKTQAAHSSTLPCLIAEDRANAGGRKFVYLKGSQSYIQQNGTVQLLINVNQADTELDGKHGTGGLREDAIRVINRVAQGAIRPRAGLKTFLRHFKRQIHLKIANLRATDTRVNVLNRYLARVESVERAILADNGYFDQLVGVAVRGHEKENLLRNITYKKRFKLIQNCEAIESEIALAILNAQNSMFGTRLESLKSVNKSLRYVLLSSGRSEYRRVLERLFGTSLAGLQAGIERNEARLRKFEDRHKIT